MGSRLTGKTSRLQDSSGQYSKHIRCNTELCSAVERGTGNTAKLKTLTSFSSISHQNPLPARVNQPVLQKRAITDRSHGKVKTDVSKCIPKRLEKAEVGTRIYEFPSFVKEANSSALQSLSEDGTRITETCSDILSQGKRKQIKQRPGCGSFYAPTISSTMRLIASRDARKTIISSSQGTGVGARKCNLKKNILSISEFIPFSRSISESTALKTSTSASSNRKLSGSLNTRLSAATTLTATSKSKINDLLAVVKPLEHSRSGATRGLLAKGNPRHPLRKAMVARVPTSKISILGSSGSSSRSLGNELSSTCHNVSERKNFRRQNSPSGPTSNPAVGRMLTFCDPSINPNARSWNNTEEIIEPPMILEWIEHNQERTYEHMLQSESNVSLGRLNFHDQYREMRMDIDNMSYEELLELAEKMGSVSTGLTDEALTKCLKRSNFKKPHSLFGITDYVEDGNRCGICLEECVDGEDIGALSCEHWYHLVCIQQWLKQKNWCPICKSHACADP
ncbi:uncharacterized protein LOC110033102 [Phalaenopsis equestris]|uniref:uncharacterized protein LOC110033102 n=1 Tax=Phalaenopsis equestris TaxID=78828 RepID=UPI0009E5C173|nr:uncharacterized protein LOC110033102 [Phalaenopsis equestris]